ncbi:MAG: FAD-dependent oxidoreductase [Ilumatobacteraceae bacterium]
MGQDRGENLKEIARHSQRDADAYDQYSHDITMVIRAVKPLFDSIPPNLWDESPEGLGELASLARHLRGIDKPVLHNLVRLLTGSAADFLDDYFESDILKGWLSSSSIIGTRVGPMSQGSGLVLLFHGMGEHDGELGVGLPQGGNGGFTQVLARAAQAFGVEIQLNAEVDRVITSNGRATGVALQDGTELQARVVVSAADPLPHLHPLRRPASCRPTSSTTCAATATRARRRR